MPKVSVIIPVYNVEKYLRECIDSVVNQTLKDIEIICIDDGSTDNSVNILKEYASKDDRFIILEQANQGAGAARNKGLDIAQGEFVAFMDGDDLYPNNNVLEKLYTIAIEKDVKICGGGVEKLKLDGTYMSHAKMEKEYTFEADGYIDYKDYQFDYGYWRFIYNRKFLNDNNLRFPNYLRGQDPLFFVKAMIIAKRFYALSITTYIYRVIPKENTYGDKKILDAIMSNTDLIDLAKKYNLGKLEANIMTRLRSNYFRRLIFSVKDNVIKKRLRVILIEHDSCYRKIYNKLFWENIFSIQNIGVHKVICILGVKLKIKSKKLVERKRYKDLDKKIKKLSKELKTVKELINAQQ